MDKKDLSFVKNRVVGKMENTSIDRIAACYIDTGSGDILFQEIRAFQGLEEMEAEQYLSFLAKGASGKLGSTAIELSHPDAGLLDAIRLDKMKHMEPIRVLCSKIRDSYKGPGGESYCILLAYGAYDMPRKDNIPDETYEYLLAVILPCPLNRQGIVFDYEKKSFGEGGFIRALKAPVHSFLYPSIDELHTDIDHIMHYTKNDKTRKEADDIIHSIFHAKYALPADEQKEVFKKIVRSGFQEAVPFSKLQDIYGRMAELRMDEEYSGQIAEVTVEEICSMVSDGHMENVEEINKAASEFSGCSLSVGNIIPKKLEIETSQSLIGVAPEELSSIKRMRIDGIDYYLVPAGNSRIDGLLTKS